MSARRWVSLALGSAAAGALLVVLPDAVFRSARATLLVAAAFVLAWVALALFVAPARNALAATLSLPLSRAHGVLAMTPEHELRPLARALVVPFVVLVVVGVAAALR